MTKATKTKIEKLILELRDKKQLTPVNFFIQARQTTWGKKLTSDDLVNGYNERLGALFGRNQLTFEQVNAAMKTD